MKILMKYKKDAMKASQLITSYRRITII